jgi:hypothetical protein
MADVGYQKPSNSILVAGNPLVQYLKVETATNMYPGRHVIKGTNDDDIVVGTAAAGKSFAKTVGWLGYEHTIKKHRPATVDTIYAGDEQAAVLSGPIVIVARLKSGESVVKGDRLYAQANGEVALLPDGDLNATFSDTEVEAELAYAKSVIAIAEETVDASGGAADIMVRSLI